MTGVQASSAGLEHRKLLDDNMLKLDSQLLNAASKPQIWTRPLCDGHVTTTTFMMKPSQLLCKDHNVKTKLVFPGLKQT